MFDPEKAKVLLENYATAVTNFEDVSQKVLELSKKLKEAEADNEDCKAQITQAAREVRLAECERLRQGIRENQENIAEWQLKRDRANKRWGELSSWRWRDRGGASEYKHLTMSYQAMMERATEEIASDSRSLEKLERSSVKMDPWKWLPSDSPLIRRQNKLRERLKRLRIACSKAKEELCEATVASCAARSELMELLEGSGMRELLEKLQMEMVKIKSQQRACTEMKKPSGGGS